jgi:hypothetical protein
LDPRSTDRPRALQPMFRIDGSPLIWEEPPRLSERFVLRFYFAPQTPLDRALRQERRIGLGRFGW